MDASPNPGHPQVQASVAFAAVIARARRQPFEWGVHDCVTFAAAAVQATTGRQVLAELHLQPTWRTAPEAAAAIDSVGSLRVALGFLFGPPVPILCARAGDVALVRDPQHPARELLAVVHHGALLAPSEAGLAVFAPTHAVAAWSVRA
jgi:hypothetical protein